MILNTTTISNAPPLKVAAVPIGRLNRVIVLQENKISQRPLSITSHPFLHLFAACTIYRVAFSFLSSSVWSVRAFPCRMIRGER